MATFYRCLVLIAASLVAVEGKSDPIIDLIKKQLELGKGDLIVNVNTATPNELETIPCIGEALAREIIKGRTYENTQELQDVKGIGEYTYKCMLPFVKVEGKTERRKS